MEEVEELFHFAGHWTNEAGCGDSVMFTVESVDDTVARLRVCHALFAKPVSVPAGPDSPIIAGEDGGFSDTVEYKAVTIAMAS